MRVRAFHVGDGDCVLLSATRTTGDGGERTHHILVDGGRKSAFQDNARDELYELDQIDLVCVSHIDDDHISGVLGLIEDAVAWRVHRHREARGRPTRRPSWPEPPAVREIWHNSLFELVGDELEPLIESSLATTSAALAGVGPPALREYAAWCDNLASGERSSMELSRRISDRQLGIPRNRPRNRLMDVENGNYRRIGPFTIRIIGPDRTAIDRLATEWTEWLAANQRQLRELQSEMLADEGHLAESMTAGAADGLGTGLGDGVEDVTPPNLASLMLLVQESGGGPTVLLTGDGTSEDILAGLGHYGKLDDDGRIHVDLLKVQHHGAEANVTSDFVDRVTADHYLFCGNGGHHNPEPSVVEALAAARLGVGRDRVGPDRPFHFWFTSSRATPGLSQNRKQHMTGLEELVDAMADQHDPDDRFAWTFLRRGGLTIDL
jgi:hypothetical protein